MTPRPVAKSIATQRRVGMKSAQPVSTHVEHVPLAPHNVEAEESVLGSVLVDPTIIGFVASLLCSDDFFIIRNKWVWEAFIALHERREPIDFLIVCHELETRGQLVEMGGPAYISHLINVVPTALHADGYAYIVWRTSVRRKLLEAASQIAQIAYNRNLQNVQDLLANVRQVVEDVERTCNRTRQTQQVSQLAPWVTVSATPVWWVSTTTDAAP